MRSALVAEAILENWSPGAIPHHANALDSHIMMSSLLQHRSLIEAILESTSSKLKKLFEDQFILFK